MNKKRNARGGIATTEAAEDFLAKPGMAERVDGDLVMVNSVVAAVHLGTSRAEVQREIKKLGITSRRFFVGPIRNSFRKSQCAKKD